MPSLDSFRVDHTKMSAPCLRLAKSMKTPLGDDISIFDLRFCTPNQEILDCDAIHTLEHLFATFMRNHLNTSSVEIIDISPMGCKTGFYMSVIGSPSLEQVKKSWLKSMRDILEVKSQNDIPELNKFQCGSYKLHSLKGAKDSANSVILRDIKCINNDDIKLDESLI